MAGHPNILLQSAALWQLALSSERLLSHPWLPSQSLTAFCRPQEVWCVGLNVAHSLSSVPCSLRSAALAAWCPGETMGDAAGEAPPVARACCFPQPCSSPAASRGLCSAVVRGTTYTNGGCLACAHQQRVGWGIVRIRSRGLATLVPEDLPCGCACRAGPPVGVTLWCCTGTRTVEGDQAGV